MTAISLGLIGPANDIGAKFSCPRKQSRTKTSPVGAGIEIISSGAINSPPGFDYFAIDEGAKLAAPVGQIKTSSVEVIAQCSRETAISG